jgi:hypothetical protein
MAIHYIGKREAEKLSGLKLDGRRKYFLWDGLVSFSAKFTTVCSGCSDDSEYSSSNIGHGCSECGYTGKRVMSFPCPANPKQVRI